MKKPDIFDLLADLPVKIIDENSFTVAELRAQSNITEKKMYALAKANVNAGKWEQVWKRGNSNVLKMSFRKAINRSRRT